ncbi:MMPL family transporter [Roseovarius atlanticus]|uniref:MMPL family transporter n=1 Tax=Roseovarius atlanticus TaxID=1641875 RepID=UPI0011876CEB|nr:MMPL family transporter [Roseovarius atlanticus]
MILGYILIGIISGLLASAFVLLSGKSILAALGVYVGVGVVMTLIGPLLMILRGKSRKRTTDASSGHAAQSPAWSAQRVSASTPQRR